MKIEKSGSVTITEDTLVAKDFVLIGDEEPTTKSVSECVILWAMERLQEALEAVRESKK